MSALRAQFPAPTIRVPVRLVTAPTLVIAKDGRLVPGLRQTDFRVYDNGVLQQAVLDTASAPVSVVLAVQTSQDVRSYLPFMAKAGAMVEGLLLGESGEAALIAYGDDVDLLKPFTSGDLAGALRNLSSGGRHARAIDAGARAIQLLHDRPSARARVLIFIGQPMDSGSETVLAWLQEAAERENVTIYALMLPEFGAAFVSDTFKLGSAPSGQRGGFQAGVDLGKLISTANRSKKAEAAADPYSILTAATGGTQAHFRKQKEFEAAIANVGVQLRSAYWLSYSPSSIVRGYHAIRVEVDVSGAKTYTRPGYWLSN